ncbi:Tox-REase-5 domain-containing protein [Arachnia propionica]|uniref:Tox-REase-5 domain-containing protein n=1 Tax=Arachnia propionica TaxID=1750 RepID=UPI0030CC5D2B
MGNFAKNTWDGFKAMAGIGADGSWSWENASNAWVGVGDFALSVWVAKNPVVAAGVTLLGGKDGAQWVADRYKVVAKAVSGMVGFDLDAHLEGRDGFHKWKKDGAVSAVTESVLNIASARIPGAGPVKGVIGGTKLGAAALATLNLATRAADYALPGGGWLIRGGVKVVDLGLEQIQKLRSKTSIDLTDTAAPGPVKPGPLTPSGHTPSGHGGTPPHTTTSNGGGGGGVSKSSGPGPDFQPPHSPTGARLNPLHGLNLDANNPTTTGTGSGSAVGTGSGHNNTGHGSGAGSGASHTGTTSTGTGTGTGTGSGTGSGSGAGTAGSSGASHGGTNSGSPQPHANTGTSNGSGNSTGATSTSSGSGHANTSTSTGTGSAVGTGSGHTSTGHGSGAGSGASHTGTSSGSQQPHINTGSSSGTGTGSAVGAGSGHNSTGHGSGAGSGGAGHSSANSGASQQPHVNTGSGPRPDPLIEKPRPHHNPENNPTSNGDTESPTSGKNPEHPHPKDLSTPTTRNNNGDTPHTHHDQEHTGPSSRGNPHVHDGDSTPTNNHNPPTKPSHSTDPDHPTSPEHPSQAGDGSSPTGQNTSPDASKLPDPPTVETWDGKEIPNTLRPGQAKERFGVDYTDADVKHAYDNAFDPVKGEHVDPRTGEPLVETTRDGRGRGWEMRYDPATKDWSAWNKGDGYGRAGKPVAFPDYDPAVGKTYSSGDGLAPGDPHPHTPPETHNRATGTPGVEHVNRGNTNGKENPKIENWLKYQEQITGWKRNNKGEMPEYTRYDSNGEPVRIDGRTWRGQPPQEVYLDAKRGYQRVYYDPTHTKGMQQQLIDEAKRQRRVLPPGAKLEWHISSREGADAISRILEDEGIYDVDVIYTPER